MSALGLFGALRFALESTRFELALRSAIGASPGALRAHALARAAVLGAPGLLLGLLVSALALGAVRREYELWQAGIVLAICAVLLGLLMSVFVWPAAVRASRIAPSSRVARRVDSFGRRALLDQLPRVGYGYPYHCIWEYG
jgi:ABC-type antimicrobial peptide transport system permease subunit